MPQGPPVLLRPDADSPQFSEILALAKHARQTVGFLPNAAFSQRARSGTLVAAAEPDGRVLGYVLYDLPRDEVRIVHLVVAPAARGRGLARLLVDRVAADHGGRRGIFLHCRKDFEADGLWPKLDFEPRGYRPGRSLSGHTLTRWYRSFGQPDLFSFLEETDTRPIATMDACVFYDLIDGRGVAQRLAADWLGEHVRLAVTRHLSQEIHRNDDEGQRRWRLTAQEPFRLRAEAQAAWKPIFDGFLDAHPSAPAKDHDDLTHAAQSIAAGATWLITTDRPFRRRYHAAASELGGLRLVSPSAFVREIDELAQRDRYRPLDLANTEVRRSEVTGRGVGQLADQFVNHSDGERLRDLRAAVDMSAARAPAVRLETITVEGEERGLVAWQVTNNALDVWLLRATPGVGETTIGRHLLGLIRDAAVVQHRETIRVRDLHPSPAVARSFADEGFARSGDTVVAHAIKGIMSLDELLRRAEALGSPVARSDLQASELERWFSPVWVTGEAIPTFFVPIRHGWATSLFDAGLADIQLLPRPWGLGLRRELVYYRSPRNPATLPAPARLVWYVSGTGPGAGTLRAVSHLREVVVGDPIRLFQRYSALGIYTVADVTACARDNRAMALRFTSTVVLDRPIALDDYRRVVTGDPKSKKIMLQSIYPISEHTFVQLIQQSTADAC